MKKLAWRLANPSVTALIEHFIKIPDSNHFDLKITLRCILSLAGAFILVQFLGVSKAAAYIGVIDPWRYPGNEIRHPPGIKSFIHSAVDKAAYSGRIFQSGQLKVKFLTFSLHFSCEAGIDLSLLGYLGLHQALSLRKSRAPALRCPRLLLKHAHQVLCYDPPCTFSVVTSSLFRSAGR